MPPIQWVPGLSRGVKRPGRGVDHPPPSSAEVKGGVELYMFLLWAFVVCYRVTFTFTINLLLTYWYNNCEATYRENAET
jgi:hypothetical protein